MSRWRCCSTEGCTLATATGAEWTGADPLVWQPSGPFTGQALSTWYLQLTLNSPQAVPDTWLDLSIDDPQGPIPFSIGVEKVAGRLHLLLNDLVIGFRKPIPGVKRFLIGIENYQFSTNPRTVQIGFMGFDADDRLVASIVQPLRDDVNLALIFQGARTRAQAAAIAESRLGRMCADDRPCCPLFPADCLYGYADIAPIGYIYEFTGFRQGFAPYGIDVTTDNIQGAEITLEFCLDRCYDPDGFYRIHVDIDDGKLSLQWTDCGHSGGTTTIAQKSFNPPLVGANGLYQFPICLQPYSFGSFGVAILAQVGLSKAAIFLNSLPFEDLTNCLTSTTFTADHFQSTPFIMPSHLRRAAPFHANHYFGFASQTTLSDQRIGCPCLRAAEWPPGPINCHGYHGEEIPANTIKARLDIETLPMLTRPADDQNAKIFYPLSLANGTQLPTIGTSSPSCWITGAAEIEFPNAWPRRNPNTVFAFKSLIQFCEMAHGILCWDQYPPPPPQLFDPLRLMEGYTLEWAAYSVLAYILAGDNEIRDAETEGQTFLAFRFRTQSQDSPEMRFWYATPQPVPFPLLRPNALNRLLPIPSRTYTLDATAFAGYVFPVASPGPQAENYIANALQQAGAFTFTVTYEP